MGFVARRLKDAFGCVGVALVVASLGAFCAVSPASAARLANARQARVLRQAFLREKGHGRLRITEVTVSTVNSKWSAVLYLPKTAVAARAGGPKIINVRREYFVKPSSRTPPKKGTPPKKVKQDLDRDVWIEVTYTGSGTRTITASQTQPYDCPEGGTGTYSYAYTDTVSQARWKYVYRMDLAKFKDVYGDGSQLNPLTALVSPPTDVTMVAELNRSMGDNCRGDTLDQKSCPLTGQGWTGPGIAPSYIGFIEFDRAARGDPYTATVRTPVETSTQGCSDGQLTTWFPAGTFYFLDASVLVSSASVELVPSTSVSEADRADRLYPYTQECATIFSGYTCRDTRHWSGTIQEK